MLEYTHAIRVQVHASTHRHISLSHTSGGETIPYAGTPVPGLFHCGDSTFPGIGLPSAAAACPKRRRSHIPRDNPAPLSPHPTRLAHRCGGPLACLGLPFWASEERPRRVDAVTDEGPRWRSGPRLQTCRAHSPYTRPRSGRPGRRLRHERGQHAGVALGAARDAAGGGGHPQPLSR